MKLDSVMEMAYPQKVARDIIIGMARPVNQHLVKLVALISPPSCRRISNANCGIGWKKSKEFG
jgi:hypothetical protein